MHFFIAHVEVLSSMIRIQVRVSFWLGFIPISSGPGRLTLFTKDEADRGWELGYFLILFLFLRTKLLLLHFPIHIIYRNNQYHSCFFHISSIFKNENRFLQNVGCDTMLNIIQINWESRWHIFPKMNVNLKMSSKSCTENVLPYYLKF